MSFAIISSLIATSLIVAKDVVSKKVSSAIHPFSSSLASFLFAIPFYVVMISVAWCLGLEDFMWKPGFWLFVLLRASSDTFAESSRMLAYREGDLSSVSAIFSLHPLITLILSPLITGDPLSKNIIYGVLLATCGTYCFLKVPGKMPLRAIIFSFAAAIFFSLNNCFDRLSAQSASPLFASFMMNMLAMIFTIPFVLITPGRIKTFDECNLYKKPLLLRGFFEATFMTLKLTAVSVLQVPMTSAIFRTALILQVFAGRTFFKEEGFFIRIIGSILVVSGAILTLIN